MEKLFLVRVDHDESTGEYTRMYFPLYTLDNHNLIKLDSSVQHELEEKTFCEDKKDGAVYFTDKTVMFEIATKK